MWKLAILLGLQAGQRACWFVPLLFFMENVAGFSGLQISLVIGTGSVASLLLAAAACGFAYAFVHPYAQFRLTDAGLGAGAAQRALTLGQLCELLALLVLAALHRVLGMKRVMIIGFVALLLRMAVMSVEAPLWLLVSVQGLHGIDFAFAAITVAIIAETLSSPETRSRAQALVLLCLWGAGRFVGFIASGWAWDRFDGPEKWSQFFVMPAVVAGLAMLVFALRFPAKPR